MENVFLKGEKYLTHVNNHLSFIYLTNRNFYMECLYREATSNQCCNDAHTIPCIMFKKCAGKSGEVPSLGGRTK